MAEREDGGHLTFRQRVLFAIGTPGWQVTGSIVVSIGIYFYLPPEGAGLQALVSEEIFLGVLTAYGLARLIGGVVDSLADPFVGHYSDRSRSRFGRRRVFLIVGIVPMTAIPGLIFFPPGEPGSFSVFFYLTVMLALYYIFFTIYVAPYLALIPEIAKTESDRVELSRLRAAIGGPMIMAFGVLWLAGVDILKDQGMDATTAVQTVVVISCIFSFVCSICPILAVDESTFSSTRSSLNMREALSRTLSNRPFVTYLLAQIVFILGITMSGPAVPYFARVILGRDEGFAALLSLVMLPGIILGFIVVQAIVDRIGTKQTLVATIFLLGVPMFPYGFLTPSSPGEPGDMFNLVVVVGLSIVKGFPIAGIMILPTVILGQLIDLDSVRTGANRAAMYYGVQGLLTKWVYAASAAILSYLLSAYGRSAEEPLGVLLIGPVAGTFCVVAAVLYTLYPEKTVRAEAAELAAEA
ncbi:MAG: MFS transporter [Gammaproteobacteria bacterium]|nr:MFS transporter [Gammaproteobacteria bacterium]